MKRSLRTAAMISFVLVAAAWMMLLCSCAHTAQTPDKVVETVSGASSGQAGSSSTVKSDTANSNSSETIVAYLCETGDVNSNGFNKQIWSGVQKFARAHAGYSAKSYAANGDAALSGPAALMAKAIDDGAKVIVCVGQSYAQALPDVAAAHSDIRFLLLDASMGAGVPSNVCNVTFDNVQAGYLAGYALVTEGYKGLGFIGGMDVASVNEFGYGFVQGADAAARRLDVADDTYMAYWLCGTFVASDAVQEEAARWFDNGVDVEFSCAGGVQENVVAAADAKGKSCIVADADSSGESARVLFAAFKNLSGATDDALISLAANNGNWDAQHAGKTMKLGLNESGVGLSSDSGWRLVNFKTSDYRALVDSIENRSVTVSEDTSVPLAPSIEVDVK